ncbi:ABC transporter permease [Pusillimonas harenae]|uniref:ABC transporter permease n=2 Tax=Pollutimonas harenae TaxID=657015 RepID=A0A853GXX1_9BURK|nr:ABC transporter permease [Pollutimonas harenae]TEA73641.1 ABC transporter permease [Pollutimonas harenae]
MRRHASTERGNGAGVTLEVSDLDVYYGQAHAVQGVTFTVNSNVLAIVGKNGMGKTSICNAVTGLIPAKGSVRLNGRELLGRPPHIITHAGIGYVPQGRRVWPSLTVHEHLELSARTANRGDWTVDRIYQLFPRLAERKENGGAQLSGGEQQMLAIGRALLFNPKLLVMDEPTEGLAPVIVEHVASMLKTVSREADISILLIEQNLGVAIDVADTIAVMANGRITHMLPAFELADDRELQQRLLGVRSSIEENGSDKASYPETDDQDSTPQPVWVVRRSHQDEDPPLPKMPRQEHDAGMHKTDAEIVPRVTHLKPASSTRTGQTAYVIGTFDTKGAELQYLRRSIEKLGVRVTTVDLATSGTMSSASISAREVARFHPKGETAVFTKDRGSSITGMSEAITHFLASRRDLGGVISAGGSGGTALATAGMRSVPVGVPKVMVSTVASGDVAPYVGESDISMMYSITDVSGLNRISAQVLGNAAHALAGMIANPVQLDDQSKPAIGLTMFGVTTTCVQAVTKALSPDYDCLVFHATGTGGRSMEALAESGLLDGVIDITTTEIADLIVGGVFSAGDTRMDAIIRRRLPYVGSCGALDMANFHAISTLPSHLRGRNIYKHNENVTLVRTLPEENVAIGKFIANKLNQMEGPVRFLIPEGGVSAIDAPGQPFHDPAANRALFSTIEEHFKPGPQRGLIKLPYHIDDAAFTEALVRAFLEIHPSAQSSPSYKR